MLSQSDDFEETNTGEVQRRTPPQSFGQRHGLKVMGVVMAVLFATVITAQVAC